MDAESVIRCFIEDSDIEKVKVRTFHSNKRKAFKLLKDNDVSLVQSSNKTRSFLDNIVNEKSVKVTVDTHAYSVYEGQRAVKASISNKKYYEVSHAYIEAANELGLAPYELQAITWVAFRRLEGIAK